MAGKGRPPKDPADRLRRNADALPTVSLAPDEALRGPELPDDLHDLLTGEALTWPAMTRRWWANWRRSPQAQTFTDTDWDFLTETALLHRAFVYGDAKVAAELRLRVAKYGATPEDRMRLRIAIVPPAGSIPTGNTAPAAAQAAGNRKGRILSMVPDAATG